MCFGSTANKQSPQATRSAQAFTLIEVLVTAAVLALVLVLALNLISNVSDVTKDSNAPYQGARTAFETMNQVLAQAVLNTYWDYDNPSNPSAYLRASELHFVLGPASTLIPGTSSPGSALFCQVPLSKVGIDAPSLRSQQGLLNAVGFYVKYSTSPEVPSLLADMSDRTAAWRMWMFAQPSERLQVYDLYNGKPHDASQLAWIQGDLARPEYNHPLANHVILLLIRAVYEDSSGELIATYSYDSREASPTPGTQNLETHQLPPTLLTTLIALSPRSAELLRNNRGDAFDILPNDANLFQDASESGYRADLAKIRTHLDAGLPDVGRVEYQIFEDKVELAAANWSR